MTAGRRRVAGRDPARRVGRALTGSATTRRPCGGCCGPTSPRVRCAGPTTPTTAPAGCCSGAGAGRWLGYQPGLDGLRALSVLVVLCYHAGFGWMPGGWIGVEVFFVVSGFLITTLLIEERERHGRVDLGQFWLRRARRLLPALLGDAAGGRHRHADRRVGVGARRHAARPAVGAGLPRQLGPDPRRRALLRQPIRRCCATCGAWRSRSSSTSCGRWSSWPSCARRLRARQHRRAARRDGARRDGVDVGRCTAGGPGPLGLFGGVDRVNFMYLSTFTRSTGLLLGAAAAFVWRPWRRPVLATGDPGRAARRRRRGRRSAALGIVAAVATLTAGYVYQWLLPLVTLLAPRARARRRAPGGASASGPCSSWRPLVAIGKRSYGLYLWHWPIFVLLDATHGSVGRFVVRRPSPGVATELSYRYVETPVRQGAPAALVAAGRPGPLAGAADRVVRRRPARRLLRGRAAVRPGRRRRRCDVRGAGGDADDRRPRRRTGGSVSPTTVAPVAPPAAPARGRRGHRRRLAGPRAGHQQARTGIEATFRITDGSLDGCSVYDEGRVRSARTSFRNYFAMCEGWQQKWAAAVTTGPTRRSPSSCSARGTCSTSRPATARS